MEGEFVLLVSLEFIAVSAWYDVWCNVLYVIHNYFCFHDI